MDHPTAGILHPGSMGAAVAACAATNAAAVLWCPAGRSPASTARAERYALKPVATLHELLDRSDTVISLCPPTAAVVDGGVIGSPPVGGKVPTLYLSGPAAAVASIEKLFAATAVRTKTLGNEIGKASELKLAHTSFQKASRVLVALATGLACEHGVDQELIFIASRRTDSYLAEPEYIAKAAVRAWRWGLELESENCSGRWDAQGVSG